MADIAARLADLDWTTIERSLWEWGYAKTPPVLTPDECAELMALYDDDTRFRSRVDMARYRFGLGEYKYSSTAAGTFTICGMGDSTAADSNGGSTCP